MRHLYVLLFTLAPKSLAESLGTSPKRSFLSDAQTGNVQDVLEHQPAQQTFCNHV